MDRNTGHGYESAFANLPVVQNAKLKTGEGVAEVEFEDNSSLRLTPNTEIEFLRLGRDPSGSTISTLHVLKGTIYVALAGHKGNNQFAVLFNGNRIQLPPSSHILLTTDSPSPRLAVFDGAVSVEYAVDGRPASTTVAKKHSLLFDSSSATAPTLVARVDSGPFDQWDKVATSYHKQYSNASAFGGSAGYGISDLNYYGSMVNLPGCGSVWRPYFASAAWDPFANGVWAWYPNAGYSWVSPYPWGWAPFHTGSWQYCGAGGGWGWQPGGQWVGLRNSIKCKDGHEPGHGGPTHLRPPAPPSPGRPTMVAVNTRPIAISRLTTSDAFVFSKDSAGLGVPRQTFGKLGRVSSDVAHHGAFVTPVYTAPGLETSRASVRPGEGHAGPQDHGGPERFSHIQPASGYAGRSGSEAASTGRSTWNSGSNSGGNRSGWNGGSNGGSSHSGWSGGSNGGGGNGGSHSAPPASASAPAASASTPASPAPAGRH